MKVAIIIGFAYVAKSKKLASQANYLPVLPGIQIDIYLASRFIRKSQPDIVIIVTDIATDTQTAILIEAINKQIVKPDILTLIARLKEDNSSGYHPYQGKSHILRLIKDNISQADQIFFYYSGHMRFGDIMLPEPNLEVTIATRPGSSGYGDILRLDELRKLFISETKPTSEIMIVLDSCNGVGFHLPFRLINGVYHLTNILPRQFIKQKEVCWSSSMSDEVALTGKEGSHFSQLFFSILENIRSELLSYHIRDTHIDTDSQNTSHASHAHKHKRRDSRISDDRPKYRIADILNKITSANFGTHQTAMVNASHPNLVDLFNWIFISTKHHYQYDKVNKLLIDD